MSVGLITRSTSKVDHLGVWAPDRGSPDAWATGRYVPICNSEKHHGPWHVTEWSGGVGDGTKRKPLCSRCRQVLTDLAELATRRDP